LNQAWQAASEELYKAMNEQQAGGAAPGAENAGPSSSSEDVQDAEIVEEK
jgi:molecular chaperone DnaK